ncbi:unnamed protein product, partial [marine sediment metagenome]
WLAKITLVENQVLLKYFVISASLAGIIFLKGAEGRICKTFSAISRLSNY